MLGALAGLAYNTGSATVGPHALEQVTHPPEPQSPHL